MDLPFKLDHHLILEALSSVEFAGLILLLGYEINYNSARNFLCSDLNLTGYSYHVYNRVINKRLWNNS